MIRKIIMYCSLACNIILILVIILLAVNDKKNKNETYNWKEKEDTTQVIEYINVGDVEKSFSYTSKTMLDSSYYKTYSISNDNILSVNVGTIVNIGDILTTNGDFVSETYGKVLEISESDGFKNIIISDFTRHMCEIKVDEEYAYNVKIGNNVKININDNSYDGVIYSQEYEIVDGILSFYASFTANGIYQGSSVDLSIILNSKKDVLRVSKEFLIIENGRYYLNIKQNEDIIKTKVEIGLIGDKYAEIKSGVIKGSVAVILYE